MKTSESIKSTIGPRKSGVGVGINGGGNGSNDGDHDDKHSF